MITALEAKQMQLTKMYHTIEQIEKHIKWACDAGSNFTTANLDEAAKQLLQEKGYKIEAGYLDSITHFIYW